MKIHFPFVLGFGLSLVAAGTAFAGSNSASPVELYTDANGLLAARGALWDARFSADNLQYIGCSVAVYDDGDVLGHCSARNAAGSVRTCGTSDPGLIKNIQAINTASFVYFALNADGETCDRVIAVNSSYNL
jgi:hypothetical protein